MRINSKGLLVNSKYLAFRQVTRTTKDQKSYESNREQVLAELKSCQERTLQTLVPTIISVGLISIADRDKFALITLVSAFSILFGSSLYIASLAHKIFRNATYLQALDELDTESFVYSWGAALSKFNQIAKPPGIIGYETTTIATIYIVFSGAYLLMFFEMNMLLSSLLSVVLATIAIKIFCIPRLGQQYLEYWREVLKQEENISYK